MYIYIIDNERKYFINWAMPLSKKMRSSSLQGQKSRLVFKMNALIDSPMRYFVMTSNRSWLFYVERKKYDKRFISNMKNLFVTSFSQSFFLFPDDIKKLYSFQMGKSSQKKRKFNWINISNTPLPNKFTCRTN